MNELCPHCGQKWDRGEAISFSCYYMHDNHTFTRIKGKTVGDILHRAQQLAEESPYGCFGSIHILNYNGDEIRRAGKLIHAHHQKNGRGYMADDIAAWIVSVESDPDLRLLLNVDAP